MYLFGRFINWGWGNTKVKRKRVKKEKQPILVNFQSVTKHPLQQLTKTRRLELYKVNRQTEMPSHLLDDSICFFKSTKEARHTRLLQIQIESTVSDHHNSNLKLPANQTFLFS